MTKENKSTKRKKRDALEELKKLKFKSSNSAKQLCKDVEKDFW